MSGVPDLPPVSDMIGIVEDLIVDFEAYLSDVEEGGGAVAIPPKITWVQEFMSSTGCSYAISLSLEKR